MTARLALILMFALVSPALAQVPAANWPADPKTNCKVWSQGPAAGKSINWSGGCANGFAQGRGVVQWFIDGKPYQRDEGEYRGGKLNGRGTIAWTTGNRYDGGFREGLYQGQGTHVWANGDRYEGNWRDDMPNGAGTKTQADGQVFSGTWANGCFKQGNRWATANATAKQCGFQ